MCGGVNLPTSLTEDFMDEWEYVYDNVCLDQHHDVNVDTIPDSDTREDDLARIIDVKSNPIYTNLLEEK